LKVVITGVAGFIGSHTAELFLDSGVTVIGIDSFSSLLYPETTKRENVKKLLKNPNFQLVELDLRREGISQYLTGVNAIVNFAALPGQALSWDFFAEYQNANLLIVSNLLRELEFFPKIYFLQISTSSIFGNLDKQNSNTDTHQPISPYGVTKLAAENLVNVYVSQKGISAGMLRLYSVYGPRQRPDMAYAKFCFALTRELEISIYGDGSQLRSITFVSDVSRAIFLAIEARISGLMADVCGEESITLIEALHQFENCFGVSARIKTLPGRVGDQSVSVGNPVTLEKLLGFKPLTSIKEGIFLQVQHTLVSDV
jgi:UDP-glucose 4-epimerase